MKIADKILGEILLHKRGEYQWYINQKPGFKEPIIEAMESYHAQFTTQRQEISGSKYGTELHAVDMEQVMNQGKGIDLREELIKFADWVVDYHRPQFSISADDVDEYLSEIKPQ